MMEIVHDILADEFWFAVILAVTLLGGLMTVVAYLLFYERKVAGWMQDRVGPNRAGPIGLLQPIADGVKALLKEDIVPRFVDGPLFVLAPALAFIVAAIGFAVIPWGGKLHWPWMPEGAEPLQVQVASLDVGVLYLLAVGSLGVYGVVLGGWASNNKYAFYAAVRSTAQMLSYEIPMGLAILVVVLTTGHLRLENIVEHQVTGHWNIFLHPLAFGVLLITAFAETNRAPFDLVECEQELVAGFHTEYSALKFAMFFLGEYLHMITNSALIVALFLGGWQPIPWSTWMTESTAWWAVLLRCGVFLLKVLGFIFVYMWVRWTLPRFRYDQLMRLAWRGLVPLGLGLTAMTVGLVYIGKPDAIWLALPGNLMVLAVMLLLAARSRVTITGRQRTMPNLVRRERVTT
jgi:NADH-quinone oxidoreductase subunit H